MIPIVVHGALFLSVAAVIVLLGCFYGDAFDKPALRAFPRRYLMFLLGCAVLVAVMLLFEHTFASVS